jgi:hypothetical protein
MLKPATPFLSKDTLFNHFYELPMKLRAYVPVVAEISATDSQRTGGAGLPAVPSLFLSRTPLAWL